MPALPQIQRHSVTCNDSAGNVWELGIKKEWDVQAQSLMEAHFEALKAGVGEKHVSSRLKMAEATILDWNVTLPDGAAAPVSLSNIGRLPAEVLDTVSEYYETRDRERQEGINPLVSSSDTQSNTTTPSVDGQ